MPGEDRRMERNDIYLSVPSWQEETAISLDALFPGKRVELEIGFGRGRFIRERAVACPDVHLVGLETKRKLVYLCAQKCAKAGIGNVTVVHGDARTLLSRIHPDGGVENVFVHFPDPWWKARHQKRMVLTGDTVREMARLLRPGGALFVQTDVDFRAEQYRALLDAEPLLQPDGTAGVVQDNPFGARSSRERRAEELGMPVFRLLYRRR